MTAATITARGWRARAPMLRSRGDLVATLSLGAIAAWPLWRGVAWAFVHATWWLPPHAGASACRAASVAGACWAVIGDRFRFIIFGAYPFDAQWRPAVACLLFLALALASARRQWWTPRLLTWWIVLPLAAVLVMHGGFAGLSSVPTELWGGLPLTFLLSTVGFAAASPLAVLLALGRRSDMPVIRALSIGYIEIVRGVPLITFLFMASLMVPLFFPPSFTVDKLLRTQLAIVLVIAAYLAEVLRGGLQAIPKSQLEAAASLGLPYWRTMLLIVLPQVVRLTIPALANTFISFLKDTSLVAIVGLFDLLGAAKAVLVDPRWVGLDVEVYLFVAAIYFVVCFAASHYTHRLEAALAARSHH